MVRSAPGGAIKNSSSSLLPSSFSPNSFQLLESTCLKRLCLSHSASLACSFHQAMMIMRIGDNYVSVHRYLKDGGVTLHWVAEIKPKVTIDVGEYRF